MCGRTGKRGGARIKLEKFSALEIDKIKLIYLFTSVGSVVLYFVAFMHFLSKDIHMFIFEILLATGGLLNLILLKIFKNVKLAENFILIGMMMLIIAIFINGGYEKTGIYWIYTFPLLSFFIKGNKEGFVWNFALILSIITLLLLDMNNYIPIAYSPVEVRQAVLAYIIVMILAYIFEDALLRSYREVSKMAITDQLTGLYNRHFIFRKLNEEIRRSERYGDNLCVILMDIDNFKSINDIYGHDVGDRVIEKFAQVLRKNIRKVDIAGRLGGEEFIVICPKTELSGGKIIAEKIKYAVENMKDETVPKITVSIGVASYTKFDTPNSLLKKADMALYRAKRTGKNKVVVFDFMNLTGILLKKELPPQGQSENNTLRAAR